MSDRPAKAITVHRPRLRTHQVAAQAIRPLRHSVLRAGLPFDTTTFEGDDDQDSAHFAVEDPGGRIVGCVSLVRRVWHGQDAWQLRGMAVDPSMQRTGIGRVLLEAAESHADNTDGPQLMWCNARVPSEGFYARHGWTTVSDVFDIPTAGPHVKMLRRIDKAADVAVAGSSTLTYAGPHTRSAIQELTDDDERPTALPNQGRMLVSLVVAGLILLLLWTIGQVLIQTLMLVFAGALLATFLRLGGKPFERYFRWRRMRSVLAFMGLVTLLFAFTAGTAIPELGRQYTQLGDTLTTTVRKQIIDKVKDKEWAQPFMSLVPEFLKLSPEQQLAQESDKILSDAEKKVIGGVNQPRFDLTADSDVNVGDATKLSPEQKQAHVLGAIVTGEPRRDIDSGETGSNSDEASTAVVTGGTAVMTGDAAVKTGEEAAREAIKDDAPTSQPSTQPTSQPSGTEVEVAATKLQQVGTVLQPVLEGAVAFLGNVAAAAMAMAVVVLASLYFAFEPNSYRNGLLNLVPTGHRERARSIWMDTSHTLEMWLMGQLGSMAFVGVFTTFGLWLLGVPLPFANGLLAGLFTFIPNFGPILAFLPPALLALNVGPWYPLYVAGLYVLAQILEGNIVTPLIQRRAVDMPPVLLLAGQFLLGLTVGLIGVALAAPLLAVMLVLINRFWTEHYGSGHVKERR